jgi:hypothetical protein
MVFCEFKNSLQNQFVIMCSKQGPATPFEKTNNLHSFELLFAQMERMDMCDVTSARESHGFLFFSGAFFGLNGDEYF